MITMTSVPQASTGSTAATLQTSSPSTAETPRPSLAAPKPPDVGRPWWAHLAWVLGASIVGFALPAIFAAGLHVDRAVFVLPYVCASAAFCYLYIRWSGVDVAARLRQHWVWGVIGAIIAGAFVVSNVFSQPASAVPTGFELVGAVLWLGMVYGTADALLLSVLPLFATWQALSSLGWPHRWYGRFASGVLALMASLAVAAAYHLGFPEVPWYDRGRADYRQRRDEPRVAAHVESYRGDLRSYCDAYRCRVARRCDDIAVASALLTQTKRAFPSVSRFRLPSASAGRCDGPQEGSFHPLTVKQRLAAHDRFPVTPVFSIATCVTPCSLSQLLNFSRSSLIDPKLRTCLCGWPLLPGTIEHATMSFLWISSPQHRSWTTSISDAPFSGRASMGAQLIRV